MVAFGQRHSIFARPYRIIDVAIFVTLSLADGFAVAKARRTGDGNSVFFSEGEVLTPDGRVVATATGIFKPGRKPSGDNSVE